ncbi:MAG: hypothetical protein HY288_14660 [Planctomycetia bacterium]|nr:hypothetical protein [Planctomycetia bacterium]
MVQTRQARTAVGFVLIFLSSLAPTAARCDTNPDATPSAQDAIVAALETKVSLEFKETPLQQIANDIAKAHKINVVLDVKSLAEAGIAPDTALGVRIAGVTLRSALNLLLNSVDLTYVIRNEVLLITTTDRASADLTTKSYNVADLVKRGEDADDENCDMDVLEDLLATTIAPSTWDEVGGPGSISAYGNCLVISQTREVHRHIDNLFAALRTLKNAPDRAIDKPAWAIDPAELAAEKQIDAALAKKTEIIVEKMPLGDFADMLRSEEHLSVQLDTKALGDAGVSSNGTNVSLSVHDITLDAALALVLQPLDLTTIVRDETLWITTTDAASSHLQVAIYPVRDLIDKPDEQDGTSRSILMNTIVTTVARHTWDEVGGPGAITAFAPQSCLVIRQTQETHAKIGRCLADLRKARSELNQDR